jgi:hypothetical protein
VTLRCPGSAKQAFRAQVFIDIRPMDAVASACDFPILALSMRSVQKARIPHKRNTDHAPISQRYTQRVVAERNVEHALICRSCRRTHSQHFAGEGARATQARYRATFSISPRNVSYGTAPGWYQATFPARSSNTSVGVVDAP